MWSGTIATIPIGWALCNGSNGTPDLRDKFVIGAYQDDGGTPKTNVTGSLTASGGAATKTLDVTEMPAHTHNTNTPNEHALNSDAGSGLNSSTNTNSNGKHASTTSAGSGTAFSLLNPYYALAFIMKL